MFEQEYQSAMKKITPRKEWKQETLRFMQQTHTPKKRWISKMLIAAAVLLMVSVCLSNRVTQRPVQTSRAVTQRVDLVEYGIITQILPEGFWLTTQQEEELFFAVLVELPLDAALFNRKVRVSYLVLEDGTRQMQTVGLAA